jgi:predicted GIY-YIG superfamily endonuclease
MGIVYLLKDDNGKYKIGITTRKSTKRLKELQTGNAEEIQVVTEFKSKWFRKIETSLHNRYGLKRLKGEWFELETKDTQNFISECQSLHNTFQMLEDSGNPFI